MRRLSGFEICIWRMPWCIDHLRDRISVYQELTAVRPMPSLVTVELNEIRANVLALSNEYRNRHHCVRNGKWTISASGAICQNETGHIRSGFCCDVDIFLARQAAHFDEGPR